MDERARAGDDDDIAAGHDADIERYRSNASSLHTTIRDLARDFGVTLRALRFYESRGLLSPARSGVERLYSDRDRVRLTLILKGKRLGFTLTEIRTMLAEQEKAGAPAKPGLGEAGELRLSRKQIAEQLELLRSQQREATCAIAELEDILQRATTAP